MQSIRCLALAAVALFMAGCSSFTSESATPLARGAQWGLVPLLNYSQAPQAGERAEQILLSVLAEEGVRPRLYPAQPQGDLQLVDDRERQQRALDWARQQKLAYVVTGSVEEWQYKNGLDGEPAVGVSLQVLEPASGRVLWSTSGARAGWSRKAWRAPRRKSCASWSATCGSSDGDVRAQGFRPRTARQRQRLLGRDAGHQRARAGPGLVVQPGRPAAGQRHLSWVILAPLLLGMRYGFVRGLASAALLVAALFAFRVQGVEAYAQVPAAFIVGVLLCAMLVGEFRDIWERRLERLELANEYRQLRLDEFTRAHHILRISHDRLEQRVAGNDQSLRSSLLGLRQLLRELPGDEAPLDALAETVLALLAQYGSLRIAGLYRVRHDRTPEPQPLATLGEMPALDADDLLVRTCLERGELVSVRQELLERGEQRAHSALQVCVPLVDTDGRILALLAVEQMPFFVFNERTFSLLAILAGHIADLLQSDRRALQLADIDAQRFSQYLKRSLLDARDHGLPACLYAFELTDARYGEEVQRLLEGSQRGLDVQLRLRNDEGRRVLLVLLPLTSAEGSQGICSA